MLRITIELVPWGMEKHKKVLKIAEIYNLGTGTKTFGNYGYRFLREDGNIHRQGKIYSHPRLKESVWKLVQKVLNQYLK